MTKDNVIRIRDWIKAVDIVYYLEDATQVTFHPLLVCLTSNATNMIMDRHDGCTIWDDDNEIVYSYLVNPNNGRLGGHYTFNRGGQVQKPMKFQAIPYSQIEIIESPFDWDMAKQMLDQMGVPADQQEKIYKNCFEVGDIDKYIRTRPKIGYSNLKSQAYNKEIQLNDEDEYLETVHPNY